MSRSQSEGPVRKQERRRLRVPEAERLASALERAGLGRADAERAVVHLRERGPRLGMDHYRWLLEGVRLATVLHRRREEAAREEREERGLQELERLMGGFSGELTKLDELLEVLAAYVKRMRTSTSTPQKRTVGKARRKPRTLH